MNSKNALVCAITVLCTAVFSARAQRLVVTPGSSSSSTTVKVFGANPFAAANTITGPAGTFYAVANPAATRYYLLSAAGVSVVNASTGAELASLPTASPATAEAITPNGNTLLVASGNTVGGTLNVYNLSGDTPVLAATFALSEKPYDVAASPDSMRGYVVTASGIALIDLASGQIGPLVPLNNLTPSGSAVPAISIAPDSLVYVSANGAVYKLNPRTLVVMKTFSTAGYPGKLAFSPNADWAVAVNRGTGDRVVTSFDLTGATTGAYLNLAGVKFSQAVFVDDTTVYAISAENGSLYSFPVDSPYSVSVPEFPSFGQFAAARALTKSTELPVPGYVFVVGSDKVYRVDSSISTPLQLPLNGTAGPSFYISPAVTGTAADLIIYNQSQNVAANGTALPLAFRVLDAAGHPLANQAVIWYGGSVTLQSAMATTNSDGIATAYAVVPSAQNTYSISAAVGGTMTVDFTLNVGSSSGEEGGGDGSAASGLTILSGNGQVVAASEATADPLVVYVHDVQGNPVSNAAVTFSIAAGSEGSLTPGNAPCTATSAGRTVTCLTNSNGIAGVNFVGASVTYGLPYSQSNITASIPAGANTEGASVSFVATNIAPEPNFGNTVLLPSVSVTAPQSGSIGIVTGQAGQRLNGLIQYNVASQNIGYSGQRIPNVGIEVRPGKHFDQTVMNPAKCGSGVQLSDANGFGACDLVLGNTPGTYSMYAIIGGFYPVPFTLTITPAPATPTTITKTGNGDNQSGTTGQTLPNPLSVVVKDQYGQTMSGVTVTFAVTSGSASLSQASATTNANGVASTNVTLGSTPGAVVVRASAGSAPPVTFNLTTTVQLTAITKVSGDNQTVVIGSNFPTLTVQVTGAQGPVQGVLVRFAVTSNNATLSDASDITDANGKASTTVTAGSQPGAVTVTATVNGLPAQTFNLTQRMPGPVLSKASFLNGASFLPNITHGAIVAIVGDGLTEGIPAGTCVSGGTTTGPLPTQVAGIEVRFGGTLSPIYHVCRTTDGKDQVTVQVPFSLGVPSNTTAVVRTGAGTGAQRDTVIDGIPILPSGPGIFEYVPENSGKIAVAVRPDGSYVSPSNPAHKGETIRLYTTGLGVSLPNARTNEPGIPNQPLYQTATVNVGGQGASGVTAEYAQNMIGIFVVTFQVPSNPAVSNGVSTLSVAVVDNGQTYTSQTSAIPIQ
jgi:uncharacterized protein (TIGR03437 family)